ncbi:hypothetical protein TESG_07970 [Trichophyton tonsurans CBS 112818]|uniref:Uncharacterized protein n=1 Tax=Trichophyton tonsurans (strain CBS 112818) TaxID=647933 RepID=F2SAS3_TRIT1|nr:hypothetical protein TESG_07970 [Trichophyton tonsurans CBS 112818]
MIGRGAFQVSGKVLPDTKKLTYFFLPSPLFANQLKPRLEDQIQKIQDPLSDGQARQANAWLELYTETADSLKKRSSSRRCVRRHAQYFARKAYAISAELFVLCSLSYSISGLPKIPAGPFYDQLEEWWALERPRDSLSKVATTICGHLPQYGEDNWRFSAALPPLSGGNSLPQPDIPGDGRSTEHLITAMQPNQGRNIRRTRDHRDYGHISTTYTDIDNPERRLPKRSRLEPRLSGNPTLFGDGQYLSFSFMRRHMIDKVPEPFRTGMESSKLWKEEQESGGLLVTNCLSLYLPEKIYEDAVLLIRIGYYDGFNISNNLGLGDP